MKHILKYFEKTALCWPSNKHPERKQQQNVGIFQCWSDELNWVFGWGMKLSQPGWSLSTSHKPRNSLLIHIHLFLSCFPFISLCRITPLLSSLRVRRIFPVTIMKCITFFSSSGKIWFCCRVAKCCEKWQNTLVA